MLTFTLYLVTVLVTVFYLLFWHYNVYFQGLYIMIILACFSIMCKNTCVLNSNRVKPSRYESKGSIYIYSEHKELLAIVPIWLALSLGNRRIRLLVKMIKIRKPLHRYVFYLSRKLFNINDKPKFLMGSPNYRSLVAIVFS